MNRRTAAIAGAALLLVGAPVAVRASVPPDPLLAVSRLVATTSPAAEARAVYAAMTPKQRAGQLFMVGVPTTGATEAQLSHLASLDVGSVILAHNSRRKLPLIAASVHRLVIDLTVHHAAPFVSTDQEGGEVQRLTGTGFAPMPTALEQGRLPPSELRMDAENWGSELAAAGVNLNLAPVADVVPVPHASRNQPIGRYDREFGHRPSVVAHHVVAVVRGELGGGIDVTAKHFPGLGRATGNTDIARHVTDPTTRHDPYLQPFEAAVDAGVPFVMVSVATYPKIDPDHPASFSPIVITKMLRHDLGFTGVVISDSFHAKAIANVAPADQAVRFFAAGGTMLLDTQVGPIHTMERAVLDEAAAKPKFAAQIKAAVLNVLTAKATANLLG